ncbi:MAG: Sodium/solute symporter, partial [uncultured Gemmatimonadaceae bacterium]
DRDPRAGGARRVGRDHRPGRRAGQAARDRPLHRLRPAAHGVRGADRGRLPLDGVARRRPDDRAAPALGALPARGAARDHRERDRGDPAVRALSDDRRRAVRAVRGSAVPRGRRDLPLVHRRAHAVGAGGADRRRDRRRDDEHALGRDQLARRGDHARHLPPAHQAPRRLAGDAAHGQAVRARVGRGAHARRPALSRGPEAAGGRGRPRHRVVHVWWAARRLLPRHLLAPRDPAGRDHGDGRGDLLHGVHRLRQADERVRPGDGLDAAPVRGDRLALVRADRHDDHRRGRHPLVVHPPAGDGAGGRPPGRGGGV